MIIRAAVLYEPHHPLVIEDLELDAPGPNEVQVRMVATGVCQTDLHPIEGHLRWPLPAVLGHEGAGVVETVGSGVNSLLPGDHVVLIVSPSCGECIYCESGRPYLCSVGAKSAFNGTLISGVKRLHKNEEYINHFFCQSSFAEHAIVDERNAIKVRSDAPLDSVCLLGCGTMTGVGGVVNTAKVEPGSSVAVFGCGGVGQSAILGAVLVGASTIIGIDIHDLKLASALNLGATDIINATDTDPVDAVREISGGGVDYAFEAIGSTKVMEQAWSVIKAGGKAVILGAAAPDEFLRIDPYELLAGKVLMGSSCGSVVPKRDIPRFVDLYMRGRLPLDKLVGRHYSLEQINDAFSELKRGKSNRSVISFSS